MNLRRLQQNKKIIITKDNIYSSIIINIKDPDQTQEKIFKLNCKWNGAHSKVIPDSFTHILISDVGRMSYYNENDTCNTPFEHYFRNDRRMDTFKTIRASNL